MELPEKKPDKPGKNTGPATAARKAAALQKRIAAARALLFENGYVVSPGPVPCPDCEHARPYHGAQTGACYVGDCACGSGVTTP